MPGVRERLDEQALDAAAVLARRDAFTAGHDDAGQLRWAAGAGIDVIRGTGRLVGPRPVEVQLADGTTRTLIARHAVVLATGSTATVPPVAGLAQALPWTSRDLTNRLTVDDTVTVPGTDWLYAVGDVCGRALLTHMGKYQARIAGDVIPARAAGRRLDDDRFHDRADHGVVPQVVFTDPQAGSVGLTEAAARAAGIEVETVEHDPAAVTGAALSRDGDVGRAKLVFDASADVIVGATFVGPGIAELVHSATVAVIGKAPSRHCGTPCPATRPSARSGYDCWRTSDDPDRALVDHSDCASTLTAAPPQLPRSTFAVAVNRARPRPRLVTRLVTETATRRIPDQHRPTADNSLTCTDAA